MELMNLKNQFEQGVFNNIDFSNTSYENAEKDIGKKADKNRKIYNGMMKTYYYQFMGPKPPKKDK